MAIRFKDNALTTLAANIGPTDTVLTVPAGKGNNFPEVTGGNPSGDHFVITMEDAAGNRELIRCDHRPAGADSLGNPTFPLLRGYGGTAARSWVAGDTVDLRLNSFVLESVLNAGSNLQTHIEGANAHKASSISVQAFGALNPGNVQAALEAMAFQPVVTPVLGNLVLTSADVGRLLQVVTAADITLPPSTSIANGDAIEFKSMTEQRVRIIRSGVNDLIDNASEYLLPSFCTVRVTRLAERVYALTVKPDDDVGDIKAHASDVLPRGWAWCDEKLLNRVAYGGLFYKIGTRYGAGDGSTSFAKPDLRGRTIFAPDNLGGVSANRVTGASGIASTEIGAVGGSQFLQSHNHGVNDPGHVHTSSTGGNRWAVDANQDAVIDAHSDDVSTDDATWGSMNAAVTGISIQNNGAGSSQNIPPCMILPWIIKT